VTNPEASQEAEIPTPVDDGQGGGVEATTIEPESIEATDEPAAEVEYINPEDLQGKMHKITVDGQEVEVSFEELTQGYNSNRAATQKFQEAAKARQEAERAVGIEQALKVNPVATITALAAEAGQSVQEFFLSIVRSVNYLFSIAYLYDFFCFLLVLTESFYVHDFSNALINLLHVCCDLSDHGF